jgi:nitrate/TMAO reductase-like tetraheme cytochrome c subunit
MNMNVQECWNKLWARPQARWRLGIPLGGILLLLLGMLALPAYNGMMYYTSTNEFCYGCHVGMDTVVEEYEASPHFFNRTGVKVTCADCHLPRATGPKILAKIEATADVYHQLVGTIDLDNFEQHRPTMAQHVWDDMRATDSRECRHCHAFERMDPERQDRHTAKRHAPDKVEGKTCIDCHQGVAHKMPKME